MFAAITPALMHRSHCGAHSILLDAVVSRHLVRRGLLSCLPIGFGVVDGWGRWAP